MRAHRILCQVFVCFALGPGTYTSALAYFFKWPWSIFPGFNVTSAAALSLPGTLNYGFFRPAFVVPVTTTPTTTTTRAPTTAAPATTTTTTLSPNQLLLNAILTNYNTSLLINLATALNGPFIGGGVGGVAQPFPVGIGGGVGGGGIPGIPGPITGGIALPGQGALAGQLGIVGGLAGAAASGAALGLPGGIPPGGGVISSGVLPGFFPGAVAGRSAGGSRSRGSETGGGNARSSPKVIFASDGR